MSEIIAQDAPSGVAINILEHDILVALATGGTQGSASVAYGVPLKTITNLLARKGVRDYLQELKAARREQMVSKASEIVYEVLEDKQRKAIEEDIRPADTTRKDSVEVAKELIGILKQGAQSTGEIDNDSGDVFKNIYTQINVLQQDT